MSKHAEKSPSSSKRRFICPGSDNLILKLTAQGKIVDTPSRPRAEGSVAHEIAEKCLKSGEDADSFMGQVFEAEGFQFTVNDNMADAVQEYLDEIRKIIDWIKDEYNIDVEMQVEVWCSLESLGLPGLDGGTSDVILIARKIKRVWIFDYKHGEGVVVEVIDNTQGLHYGLGSLLKLGIEYFDDWKITLGIAQPRAHHPDGRIRTWNLPSNDVFDWMYDELIPAIEATYEPDAPLVPSDEGCRFCPAAPCSALSAKVQELAIIDFEDLADNEQFPVVGAMSVEHKKTIMLHADMFRSFIKKVEAQVKVEVEAGSDDYEDSCKLVEKITHRQFTHDAFDPDFGDIFEYLDEGEVYKNVLKNLGDIESALKKKHGKKRMVEIMGMITTKPKGELVIAPIADAREAKQRSAISDFEGLGD